ncbi:hypothetical protein HK100_005325 [Physocladia obscura]|uniref:Uncharacterized protein n=1 Tax=Physocladia obscura TaxID=109957 RepID=A0AAD5TAD2_9FUNG|nr:hypothetical protein HK100_005325 [Physocladia obscura]
MLATVSNHNTQHQQLTASLDSTRTLVSLLRSIHQQPANSGPASNKDDGMSAAMRGLVLSVLLPHRICQLHATLPLSVFTTFNVPNNENDDNDDDEDINLMLCVHLDSFLEAASIFGGVSALPFANAIISDAASSFSLNPQSPRPPNNRSNRWHTSNRTQNYSRYPGGAALTAAGGTSSSSAAQAVSLDISHDEANSDLILTLSAIAFKRVEQSNYDMKCANVKSIAKLKTLDIESTQEEITELETLFAASDVACKLIMKSIWLTHAISELDQTTDTIRIQVRRNSPHLRISSRGMAGETVVEYTGGNPGGTAADEVEALESVFCNGPDVSYELSSWDN